MVTEMALGSGLLVAGPEGLSPNNSASSVLPWLPELVFLLSATVPFHRDMVFSPFWSMPLVWERERGV